MKVGSLLRIAREGAPLTRLQAVRDARAAARIAATRTLLVSGLLDAVGQGPVSLAAAADAAGVTDLDLCRGLLEVGAAYGLVEARDGRWLLGRRGRALVGDPTARALVDALAGYHLDLYRDLPAQLSGRPGRDDLEVHAELIARVSSALVPVIADAALTVVDEVQPERVLDIGCGEGEYLAAMLDRAPRARGVGLEADERVAALATRALAAGHGGRAAVLTGSAPDDLDRAREALGGPADVVLLANVIYYVAPEHRVTVLRHIASVTAPGGAVVVVTAVVERAAASRHIALLFRAQRVPMILPSADDVVADLRGAGLVVARPRRLTPGEAIVAVVGRRPA